MNLQKLIFVNNDCYKAGRKINVKGIMVHSTGANNPALKRYVGPDDGLLGKNQYNNHWNQSSAALERQVCVHGFVGKLADGSIATYQTLPWDHRGWHGGSGPKGCVNDTHIGFEICEDGLTDAAYFNAVYKEAAELCAYLCKLYNLNPTADGVIIGHYEGHARGIATNHGDPKNWFPQHAKSMDTFRAYVKELMSVSAPLPNQPSTPPANNVSVPETTDFEPYLIKITTSALNVRSGPGTNHAVTKTLMNDKNIYTIVEEADGLGAKKWGKLKSGLGWISLDYTLNQ